MTGNTTERITDGIIMAALAEDIAENIAATDTVVDVIPIITT